VTATNTAANLTVAKCPGFARLRRMRDTYTAPVPRTGPRLLDYLAAAQPDHEAVVDGATRWSYADLRLQAQTVAAGLAAMGVQSGDRVAILAGNRAEWVAVYFGIQGVGAVTVALNTWLTALEIAYQLEHAGTSVLVVEPNFRGRDFASEIKALQADGRLSKLREIIVLDSMGSDATRSYSDLMAHAPNSKAWDRAEPHDVCCILYTSGSTAAPKGVPLTQGGVIDNMWSIGERMALAPQDRLWFGVSLFWSFGCVNALFAVMSHGGTLVLQHHFEPGEALRLIECERCSVFYGMPNMAIALESHPDRPTRDLSSLRTGATIGTPEQIQRIVDLGAHEICNVYGLTEGYGNSAVADCKAPLEQRLNASGAPLDGVEIRIVVGESGRVLPQGDIGEIQIGGRFTPGYWDAPDLTAASLSDDGWFRTGDLGLLDENGWVRFRGRLKELIKTGGINVSPAEVEEVLLAHPAVASCFVTGLKDAKLDETVAAVIILNSGFQTSAKELQAYCRNRIAPYKLPRRWCFTKPEALPLTSTGKLQRNRLSMLFSDPVSG
jgi:fatty-acyl-CoA synthase